MNDWMDQAADGIRRRWDGWEEEAGRLAQSAQSPEAGDNHMVNCIGNYLRHMHANHSKRPETDRDKLVKSALIMARGYIVGSEGEWSKSYETVDKACKELGI